jgi:C_GCAxxG_C_C family probable redox protein
MHQIALNQDTEALINSIRERAENLFHTKKLLCSEAILVSLNHGLGGGLSDDQAVALASGFAIGLGESGCLCGAISGGIMALGLLLGKDRTYARRKEIQDASAELHNRFKQRHQSTCCRVLTKPVKGDTSAHFKQCTGFTGDGAEITARLILERRPELAAQANGEFLNRRDNGLTAGVSRIARRILG